MQLSALPARESRPGEVLSRVRSAARPSCAACGTELPDTAKFCPECGRPVGAGAGAPSEPAPPEIRDSCHLHPAAPRRADPHLEERAGRRAQARHRALLRPGQLDRAGRAPRRGGDARARERLLRRRPRRGASLRGHRQPVPRRRLHGALRRPARPRGSRAPRGAGRARRRPGAPRPAHRRRARKRDHPHGPDGPPHRLRDRRGDRRQPADGLHGGRRHDPSGRPPPAAGRAGRDPRERGHLAPRRGVHRRPARRAGLGQGPERARRRVPAARRRVAPLAPGGRRAPRPEPLRRTRPRARDAARPVRRRRGRAWPGGRDRRRARRREVPPLARAPPAPGESPRDLPPGPVSLLRRGHPVRARGGPGPRRLRARRRRARRDHGREASRRPA